MRPTKLLPLFAALLALLPGGALAAEPGAAGILTRAPELLEAPPAEYPAAAREAGLSGAVLLEIDIGESGDVLDVRVVGPAGHGFDEAAVAAARRFRFRAAEVDGKPAAVTIEYRTAFAFEPPPAPAAEAAAPEPAPRAILAGQAVRRGTREPVAGALVDVDGGATVVATDGEGRFSVEVAPGEHAIAVVAPGFARFETNEVAQAGQETRVRYYLRAGGEGGLEAVVIGQREKKEVATVALSVGEVTRIPGVSGDTVKVVQNLPGSARTGFGSGELVLRGGNPHDTRVYVDGQEVPMIFHFGGLTSIYSSELVKDVEYEPGNFGVRYGRAIAGRVELKTRDPNEERLHLVADADLYDATLLAEGPVAENVAVAVAARRSYVDAVLNAAMKTNDDFTFALAPRYYDVQAQVLWRPSERDEVRFTFLGTDDKMELTGLELDQLEDFGELAFRNRFFRGSATWDRRLGPDTRARLLVSLGQNDDAMEVGPFLIDEAWSTGILRAELAHDLGPTLTLAGGFDGQALDGKIYTRVGPLPQPNHLPSPDATRGRVNEHIGATIWQPGAWVEATWKPAAGLAVVPGLRADHDSWTGEAWVDPRLAARYRLFEGTTLKGGVGLYHQPPPIAYASVEWGNPDLGPEAALQYGLGVEQRLGGPLSLDLQVYYKDLFDLAAAVPGTVVRDGRPVPERFDNSGAGQAYGGEALLRWDPDGRFFGWIAYSLSRTEREDEAVGGTLFESGAAYDQPHNLVAVGSLELPELTEGLSFGWRVRYTSGSPYRPVTAAVYDADGDQYREIPSASRDGRLADYFTLDLRVDKKWTWDTWTLTGYLDVQNVTNRENPEGASYSFDYSESGTTNGLPLFPSFGLRAEY